MQTLEQTRLDEQAPEDASSAVADPTPKKRGRPAGSKNAKKKVAKKKTAKKKATKKKTAKKKAARKEAASEETGERIPVKKVGKKKAAKKKRGKKKITRSIDPNDGMSRLLAAVEELREAVVALANEKAQDQKAAVSDLRRAAQERIADIEDMALRTLRKLGL